MTAGDSDAIDQELFARANPAAPLTALTSWTQVRELLDTGGGRLEFIAKTERADTRRVAMVTATDAGDRFHVDLRVEIAGVQIPSLRLRLEATINTTYQVLRMHFAPMTFTNSDTDIDVLSTEPDLAGGQVLVHTESGTRYEIDLDARYLRRIRGTEPVPNPEVAPASQLRRDETALKILRIHALQIGKRAIFDLEPLGDPTATTFTRRTTTIVTGIEHVDGEHEI